MKRPFPDFSSSTVVVIGDVILDVYFMGEVRRLSPEAPVPIVRVKEKSTTLGGAGNVALNVAGLGSRVVLLAVRGDDSAGERLSEILRERGISGNLIVDHTRSTTSKTRIIGQGQQLLRLDEEETWEVSVPIRDRLLAQFDEVLDEAGAVILSDYDKGVLNGEIPEAIIRRCRAKSVPVFVDPKRTEWERYQGATCITPNTAEVEVITGTAVEHNEALLVDTARSLRDRYHFEWVLVTRGPKGMCLIGHEGSPLFITSVAREVYDVTGAGDTVIATLAAGVASGLSFTQAAELSNMAAGIVVGKLGSQAITAAELEAAMHINGQGGGGGVTSKITTLNAAQVQVKAWQAMREKIIFTDGHFDLLHPGHIHILQQAKELGDRLVVGINADATIRRLKGSGKPILSERERAYVLSALDCVDLVVPFDEDTPLPLIKALRPDILVSGAGTSPEHAVGREVVEAYGGKVHFVTLLKGYEQI